MVTGFNLDRFQYVSRLGSGGSSTVVLAEDTLLGRRVALKRIHAPDDVAARSRLRREALIGASLSHPNLVSIYDVVTSEDGEEMIVMEYVEGETLAHALRRGDRPDVTTALEMLDGVGAALDAIHARGIIHRDVKPGNILLGVDGSVKLADLGIAAVPDRTKITTAGSVLGTVSYMAPEQLEGTIATRAVDIYALAAVAFEALSGVKARREPNALALAHAMATQPPPDLRTVWPTAPAAAAEVLIRGMARQQRDRPRSAGELTRRLRAAFEPQPTAALAAPRRAPRRRAPAPVPPITARPRSRAGLLAAVATLFITAAVAAIVLANTGGARQQPSSHPGTQLASRPARHSTAGHSRVTAAASGRSHSTPQVASHASAPSAPAPTPAPASVSSGSPTSSAVGSGSAASPVSAVMTFYRLAASHQYAAAWALTDPSFRQELAGYQGLESTMAAERAILFNEASVVDESPTSATVSLRTTSVQDNGTQNCSGTVNLLRGGSPGWLLDHIAIGCV